MIRKILLAQALALLTLSACGPAATPPPLTSTPQLISECFPYYDVQVWADEDGDGALDPEEQPLAGVPVTMYPLGNSNRSFPAQTNAEGLARVNGNGRHAGESGQIRIAYPIGDRTALRAQSATASIRLIRKRGNKQ